VCCCGQLILTAGWRHGLPAVWALALVLQGQAQAAPAEVVACMTGIHAWS
jgi:hypothetical protein